MLILFAPSSNSIPALSGFSNNDIEYKYQWITNDNSASFLICEAFVDANDNITAWAFQTSPPPSSAFSLDTEYFKIYPIPATNTLNIEYQEGVITDLKLTDIQGKVVVKSQFNSKINLSLAGIAKGVYYLTLKNEENYLFPQRIENIKELIILITKKTNLNIEAMEISYISPLWTYKLLSFLSVLMIFGEIIFLWLKYYQD